jgi:hypothetical protein
VDNTPDWVVSLLAYGLVLVICAVGYVADDAPRLIGLALRDVWPPALGTLAIVFGRRAAQLYGTNRGTLRELVIPFYGLLALACVALAVVRAMK